MAGNQVTFKEEIQEDVRKFGALAGQLQLYVWVYKHELEDFLKNNQDPAKERMITGIGEISGQLDNILNFHKSNLNKHEQRALLNSVEVNGIPEEFTTNMRGVVSILKILLRIKIEKEYILGFERVANITPLGSPRTLVVHFINQNIKKRILHVAGYDTVKMPGTDTVITFTDHLTEMNHQLLRKARLEAHRLQINNIWVDEGRIFVQKDSDALLHEIRCKHDIEIMNTY